MFKSQIILSELADKTHGISAYSSDLGDIIFHFIVSSSFVLFSQMFPQVVE